MAHQVFHYTSYLVRMWRQGQPDQPETAAWIAEIEHIQTGQRCRFSDPQALGAFLNQSSQTGEHDEPHYLDD